MKTAPINSSALRVLHTGDQHSYQTGQIAPAGNHTGRVRLADKLIDAGVLIASERPAREDFLFTHSVLCQVGLPRSEVKGENFLRQSGDAWVNVQAGFLDEGKGPVLQPVPYGVMPRLALAYVSTFALGNKTREIPIGNSAAQFLELMGMVRILTQYRHPL